MLSFQTTYAIQILDLLQQSEDEMSVSDIHTHFTYLPTRTIITDVVRSMEIGELIRKISGRDRRLRIAVSLSKMTLYDLILIMDGKIEFGKPVCFPHWYSDYLRRRPHVAEMERELEEKITAVLRTVTVAELCNPYPCRTEKSY